MYRLHPSCLRTYCQAFPMHRRDRQYSEQTLLGVAPLVRTCKQTLVGVCMNSRSACRAAKFLQAQQTGNHNSSGLVPRHGGPPNSPARSHHELVV